MRSTYRRIPGPPVILPYDLRSTYRRITGPPIILPLI
jgi:hypothetical protein